MQVRKHSLAQAKQPARRWRPAAGRALLVWGILLLLSLPAAALPSCPPCAAGSPRGGALLERTDWVQRNHLRDRELAPGRYFRVTAAVLGGAGIAIFLGWTAVEWWERR